MITSSQNSKIKETVKLYDRSAREASGLFLIEGIKELARAIEQGVKIQTLFVCPEILKEKLPVSADFEISKDVFEKLTYRGTTGGFLAVAETPKRKLETLKIKENSVLVILENMEKPGNVGAVLRTADGAGVAAVIVCDPVSDLYNPNVVRASLGALFSVPTVSAASLEAIAWLKKQKIKILAATPVGAKEYTDVPIDQSVAIAIGSEKDGLTKPWLDAANERIVIPMRGKVDSLNASVSAAILTYEYTKILKRN